jgi:fimbrial chaperone protein
MIRFLCSWLCGLLAALFSAGSAFAFEIGPVSLVLPRDNPVGVFHVANNSPASISIEMLGYRWHQQDGRDFYEEEPALIITPPLFTLAPGERRLVRAGIMEAGDWGEEETAFRVLARDISPLDTSSGLRVRLQMLLPVFLEAASDKSALSLALSPRGDGALCLHARNEGNIHEKLLWLKAPSGARLMTQQYYLPGAAARECVPWNGDGAEAPFQAALISAGDTSPRFYDLVPGDDARRLVHK